MTLVVFGAVRTKKTSNRVLRFGRFNKVVPSAEWCAYRDLAVPQLRAQWGARTPLARDVRVTAIFYRDRRVGDLVGYMQSIADVLEEAGVLEDDKYVVSWDGTRLGHDKARPRVELVIEEL